MDSHQRSQTADIDIQTDSAGKEAQSMLIAEDTVVVLPGSGETLTD